MPTDVYLEFIHLSTYRRSVEGLIDDAGQRAIESMLVANPNSGATVAGTGGVRKLRIPLKGRGKRGGARLIYYYRERKGRIYLILAYAKGRREDLTPAERAVMKKLTTAIDREQ